MFGICLSYRQGCRLRGLLRAPNKFWAMVVDAAMRLPHALNAIPNIEAASRRLIGSTGFTRRAVLGHGITVHSPE